MDYCYPLNQDVSKIIISKPEGTLLIQCILDKSGLSFVQGCDIQSFNFFNKNVLLVIFYPDQVFYGDLHITNNIFLPTVQILTLIHMHILFIAFQVTTLEWQTSLAKQFRTNRWQATPPPGAVSVCVHTICANF